MEPHWSRVATSGQKAACLAHDPWPPSRLGHSPPPLNFRPTSQFPLFFFFFSFLSFFFLLFLSSSPFITFSSLSSSSPPPPPLTSLAIHHHYSHSINTSDCGCFLVSELPFYFSFFFFVFLCLLLYPPSIATLSIRFLPGSSPQATRSIQL